jgi:sugar/nucleoside kinase (ribokinase family)
MSILVVGSVAFDTIVTPSGRVNDILGGAATYFALAASYFTEVRVVAVVGDDFKPEHEAVLTKRRVDTRGIERAQGKTFRWGGQYLDNLNEAKTDFTELNVFEKFQPRIPKEYSDTQFLFLANIQPTLQSAVRLEMDGVRLTGCDTMNFWIKGTPGELAETLKLVDVLLINDTETKMLAAGEKNLPRAAQKVLAMGPSALVVKHGEYGATIFFREGAFGIGKHPFRAPALPIEEVKDPTGAGDSFAGGFMGYIASQGEGGISREVLKRALFYGGVMGSFAVESFGTERLQNLTRGEIDARFQIFRELTHLE